MSTMHFMETDDSSEESVYISCRKRRSQPISTDEDEMELAEVYTNMDTNMDTNVELQQEEWQPIQQMDLERNVVRNEHTRGAELLARDVNCDNPLALYKLFVTDSILRLIVDETNRYAIQCGFSAKRRKHEQRWEPVTISDIKVFIGIILIMGIVRMPDIRLYWSQNKMYENERIKNAMKRDRFLAILKCLHFSDNTTCTAEDPLNKIRNVMSEIMITFKNTVKPGKTVVIDESMILWPGRLRFRQYVKGKHHKYGIKLYKLCLPNGYTYDLDIYDEKSINPSRNGHAYDVVSKLMDSLLFEGRVLYTDSYYSSIPLAQSLLQKETYLCGTVRQNEKFLPADVKKRQKRGEIISFENRSGVKLVKWTDKRPVCMITTWQNHTCRLIAGKLGKYKPDLVFHYNDAKKGVDISDQMSSYYDCLKKTIKWYKKIVIQLICGTAVVNAHYVHKQWGNRKLSLLKFREQIINELLDTTEITRARTTKTDKHFLQKYSGSAREVRKRCTECYKKLSAEMGASVAANKTKRVTTFCGHCENRPPLCLQCFQQIHENKTL